MPQCDVAIGMIKVLLDDVLSNVLLSVLHERTIRMTV
jgi:hypothetical protein